MAQQKKINDKRFYPRVPVKLPAVVANEDGIRLNVVTLDTSSDGIRIQCTTAERNLMTPEGSLIRNGRPVELLVWIDLPDPEGGEAQIFARCHITFSRRVAKDICQIGMRYMTIENDGLSKLNHFIASESVSNDCSLY